MKTCVVKGKKNSQISTCHAYNWEWQIENELQTLKCPHVLHTNSLIRTISHVEISSSVVNTLREETKSGILFLVWIVVQATPTFIEVPSDLSRGQTQSSVISAFLFSPSPSVGLLSSSGYTITSLRRKNTENWIQVEKRLSLTSDNQQHHHDFKGLTKCSGTTYKCEYPLVQ